MKRHKETRVDRLRLYDDKIISASASVMTWILLYYDRLFDADKTGLS